MTFQNPPMLVGLAAALVPLALHLLNRSRYRNVDWAAMMFLVGVDARSLQSTRLKQWLLLALRSALLALLAIALARPVMHRRDLPPARPGRTAAVLVLDRSGSMSLNDNGRLRLDLAREAIFQLLSPGFHRGDDLWLIALGDRTSGPGANARIYSSDPQEMARRVKEVPAAGGVADVAAGLREALEILAAAEAPNREIYVISDRQASSWTGMDEPFAAEWRQQVARQLPQRPRLCVVPIGTDETDNVAVEAVQPTGEPIVFEQPASVEVKIHNYGSVPRAAVPLTVTVKSPSGAKPSASSRNVNLPAAGVASIDVPIAFTEAGSNLITAKVTAPGLLTDKELSISVDVARNLRVLVIDGDEREGTLQSGADFLRLALAPYSDANPKRNTAVVSVLRPDAWGPADVRDCRVLILANVPSLTEVQADAIQQFVYDGGGLIVAPGDQARVENYNAALPWLPASLQPAIAESESAATALGVLELTHPIFRFLQGHSDAAPPVVKRYFPATARPGAATLASYGDGKPMLLERSVGRGRVLLMTTPVDPDWNSMPLTHFFLPFVQSAVRYVAAAPAARHQVERNLSPGQPLVAEFDEPLDAARVVVTVPSRDRERDRPDPSFVISQFGAGAQVRFDGTAMPGIYRVQPHGGNDLHVVQFVVSTPVAESNLAPLAPERWEWAERELGVQRLSASDRRPLPAAQEAARGGLELWLPLLGTVLALSIVELSATRRWAGGGGLP
jgi:hypothetical protein